VTDKLLAFNFLDEYPEDFTLTLKSDTSISMILGLD
jgi:hypothetical protein